MANAVYEMVMPDGKRFTVEAPITVPEATVFEAAKQAAPSWENGGHYLMEGASEDESAEPMRDEAVDAPEMTRNQRADAAVRQLDAELKDVEDQIADLATRGPRSALLEQGPNVRYNPQDIQLHILELTKRRKALQAERDRLSVGFTGSTVGGMGGAIAGAGAGALLGSPFGPPGMAVGGLIGSLLGAAGGEYAGARLWDIPQARDARDISDEEAVQLAQNRAIDALIWDAGFAVILGPGGRVIGKLARGSKLIPALKAAAKETIAWDAVKGSAKRQMEKVIAKRANEAPPRIGTQVSDALDVLPPVPAGEAARSIVRGVAERSGGHIPTTGEMRGMVTGGEAFVRSQAPVKFFHNDRLLAETAEQIRSDALNVLDQARAYEGADLGAGIRAVRDHAKAALKSQTSSIFEEAAQKNISADMTAVKNTIDAMLARKVKLDPSEIAYLERMKAFLDEAKDPFGKVRVGDVQDMISGMKERLRGSIDVAKPSEFMEVALNKTIEVADDLYTRAIGRADPDLAHALEGARKLWRETYTDIYSDTMSQLARRRPEDVGAMLTVKGTQTEIRDLRKALDRAIMLAPAKAHYVGKKLSIPSKTELLEEKARIDAGLVKGFIEKQTQSITDLERKLADPDFKRTLKELLTGPRAAHPERNMKVLAELDRVLGTLKTIKPERAPVPGRIGPVGGQVSPGMMAGAVVPQAGITTTVVAAITTITGVRTLTKAIATAMTTGNTGILRKIQRATALAPAAGKNQAAAEALLGIAREVQEWNEAN